MKELSMVYFSATGSTEKVLRAVGEGVGMPCKSEVNLFKTPCALLRFSANDVVLFGMPVYSGRLPELAKKQLSGVSGHGALAIIVCVYGNREYDDALLELKDVVENRGFRVVSAGAFVGQHSIFPEVANGRPDASDIVLAKSFGAKSGERIDTLADNHHITVPGNRPYREVKAIPVLPRTMKGCNRCGVCVAECPVGAIDAKEMQEIDSDKCLRCGHCIQVCAVGAKRYGGLLYTIGKKRFVKCYMDRKEPYFIY